LLVLFKLM